MLFKFIFLLKIFATDIKVILIRMNCVTMFLFKLFATDITVKTSHYELLFKFIFLSKIFATDITVKTAG